MFARCSLDFFNCGAAAGRPTSTLQLKSEMSWSNLLALSEFFINKSAGASLPLIFQQTELLPPYSLLEKRAVAVEVLQMA